MASTGGILNVRAKQSTQQRRSKTTQVTTGRQSPLQTLPLKAATRLLVARCMSSTVAPNRVGNPWKTVRTSLGWEEEGRPVAPILSGKQKLPSNLKLAVEASSQGEGHGEGDGECVCRKEGWCFSAWPMGWRCDGVRHVFIYIRSVLESSPCSCPLFSPAFLLLFVH